MDLVKVCSKALVVAKPKGTIGPEKKKVNVLDEEKYTEEVEKIIEKDFFPDLSKMKAQTEYFEALEKNDLVKLREIQMRYAKRPDTGRSMYSTPATFETPEHREHREGTQSAKSHLDTGQEFSVDNINHDPSKLKQHLDAFMSKNTSEDNDSFNIILIETEKKKKEKHAWLYENETSRKKEEEDRLALPSIEEQAALTDGKSGVDTWKYEARNAIMYVPDGVDYSATELVELKKKKARKIMHDNTRFKVNPWNNKKNSETIKQAATENALNHSGRIGHDGKEIDLGNTPKVKGYGFVATPSPAPGVEESPLMTWGEIEGTPFQLEANETPITASSAPGFKMPAVPKRDRLGFELAEKASKQHRDKKQNALKIASRFASPVPKFGGKTTADRIASLSPAAQRLIGSRIGVRTGTDKALRESYSPSPSHRLPGDKTPVLTPKLKTPSGTPGVGTPGTKTPGSSTPGSLTPGNKRQGSATPSLTDNLLQIPKKRSKAADLDNLLQSSKKRSKAADFF